MHITIFATDKCLFFDPYHIGVIGSGIENRTFCMNFEPNNNSKDIYTIFKAHFDTLWNEAISFNEFNSRNASSQNIS